MVCRRKIFLVATEYAPGMIPFAASVINTLAESNQFDICCLCVNSKNRTYLPYINVNAKPFFIEYPSRKWKKILYKFWPFEIIKAIRRIIKEEHPDIIHFLTGDFSLALFLKLFNTSHMCYTVHDVLPHKVQNFSFLSPFKRLVINGGYKICRTSIQNLTTSSKSQFEVLKKIYPDKKICFTNFPSLVTQEIVNGKKVPIEIENEEAYILFFGNVLDYKGVDVLISAFKNIRKECKSKLVIAGKGALESTDCPNIIRINRYIDDLEIRCLFEKARIVVYPYKSATMSGVLSLAFFFKKRILLSDVPFFIENASNSTIFFKNGDVLDLTEKLKDTLNLPDVDNDDSYERIYSRKALLKTYISFYENVNE